MVLNHPMRQEGQFPAERPDPLAELERETIVRRILNTVDPVKPGHVVRMECVAIVRAGTTETPPARCVLNNESECLTHPGHDHTPVARDTTGEGDPSKPQHQNCPTCTCEIRNCPGCGKPQTRSAHSCNHCSYWQDR